METKVFDYCRTCLRESTRNMKKIEEFYGDELKFEDLLNYLFGNNENSSGLPIYICNECEEKLIQAYLFKKQCLKSESQFLDKILMGKIYTTVNDILNQNTIIEDIKQEIIQEEDDDGTNISAAEEELPIQNDDDDENESLNVIQSNLNSSSLKEIEINPNEILNFQSIIYGCQKCNIKFQSRNEYNNHYAENHFGIRKCSDCGKLKRSKKVQQEENVHNKCHEISKTTNHCSHCGKLKPDQINNDKTEEEIQENPPTVLPKQNEEENLNLPRSNLYSCNKCDKIYKSKKSLKRHSYYHLENRCEYCGKHLSSLRAQQGHIERFHQNEKTYQCYVCTRKYNDKDGLASHMRIHAGKNPLTCSYCFKTFKALHQLKYHIGNHTKEKNWICKICNNSFKIKFNLQRHHKIVHEKHFCKVCSKEFNGYYRFKNHEKSE